MPDNTFDAESHVDHMAAALGLAIDPDYRPGVVANMARTAEIARLVTEFPLPDGVELAPAFRPGEESR
ncbi:DUF4089 domain-containing protein [Skermanella pratensis]|uniref:DUF4089 domain-containing protein n=1 Tax=Skermanella pratensis TaxID=2233999 RepID=UPI0013015C36|nr:DUF4089 domain-containing protein [Skermanella pratensis]